MLKRNRIVHELGVWKVPMGVSVYILKNSWGTPGSLNDSTIPGKVWENLFLSLSKGGIANITFQSEWILRSSDKIFFKVNYW